MTDNLLKARAENRFTAAINRFTSSKKLFLLACFFLPLVITWVVFIIRGVYPFGEKSVLVLDLNAQYVYFFEAMKDIFQGEGSAFYSWFRSLGGEFSGIYAYYVASPFALLSVFFPENGITEFLLVMTLLKVGSSGLTMGYYLYKSKPSKPVAMVLFSTCYAMTSYAVVQANNTMWIDSLIYLPLIALGIESIVKHGKFTLYTVTLSLCFISNFYIGWMTAIFSALYFFYAYLSRYSLKNFDKFFFAFYKWLIFSVLSAAVAAIIILPTYYSLQFGKADFSNPSYAFEPKFDFIKVFTQMLPNSYDTVRPIGLPFIYSGLICLVLLPVFFVTGKIKAREKIAGGIILACMVLSFTASTIDIFWHGMQKPNWLNYRYSYMFCFLVIVFAYQAFRHLKADGYRKVLGSCAAIGVLLVIIQAMDDSYFTIERKTGSDFTYINNIYTIWFSIIIVGILAALLWAVAKNRFKGATAILLTVVCCELFVNAIYDVQALNKDVLYSSRSGYVSFMDRWSGITRSVQEQDDSLFRMEKTVHRKVNDNMALRIKGITHSTSTLNASAITLLNKLGYASKSHWSRYVGGNIVNDALIGIKYVLTDDPEEIPPDYELLLKEIDPTTLDEVDEEDREWLYAYVNEYALPIMYGVDTGLLDYDINSDYSAPDVLDSVVSAMLGREVDMFEPLVTGDSTFDYVDVEKGSSGQHRKWSNVSGKTGTVYVDFPIEKDGSVYMHFPSKYSYDLLVRVKTTHIDTGKTTTESFNYMTNDTHTMKYLGEFSKGDTVRLEIVLKNSNGRMYYYKDCGYIFHFNEEEFKTAFAELKDDAVNITEFSDTKIKGTVVGDEGGELIFTSIPYDSGWTVKVDGKKVDIKEEHPDDSGEVKYKALGSLLCFEVPEGEHTVELTFTPQGFRLGSAACIVGLGVIGFFTVRDFISRRKRKMNKLRYLRAPGAPFGPKIG